MKVVSLFEIDTKKRRVGVMFAEPKVGQTFSILYGNGKGFVTEEVTELISSNRFIIEFKTSEKTYGYIKEWKNIPIAVNNYYNRLKQVQ